MRRLANYRQKYLLLNSQSEIRNSQFECFISIVVDSNEACKVKDKKFSCPLTHGFISVVVDSQGEKSGIGHFFANTGSNVQ